ncbi:Mbeg1-like protein [Clostridium weizhouense]|uniref:DUF2974 domain-containing protein n=1 Tax=Clostridium weizhouense TaxID=2859781 RepID=A0ABS7ALK8_9CLOT|nr:Mbeg1-like protein [Clostridium weizhouense]MBW6409554.1 DUF2974 domain-containing protein [Clostridium weizhouense]
MYLLSDSELLLLSNFIYLNLDTFKEKSVKKIINDILYKGKLNQAILTNGECKEVVKKSEWISIIEQIYNDSNLMKLKIEYIETDTNGVKTATFIYKDSITVVFRGTKTLHEWGDNGEGAYKIDTSEQIKALNYINNIPYKNIVVTGHSKGGNKAKYVTLLSDKVNKCISFDGQGFSNEFINKYKNEILKNKNKIISISAKYDYVNCLLNSIDEKKIYIYTELQKNPFYYHKAGIMLDGNGTLRAETEQAFFSNIINEFSIYVISELPEPHKSFVINSLTVIVELFLCGNSINKNILEIVKGTLLLFDYTKHYKLKNEFSIAYNLLLSITFPLVFWNDFIKIDESNSKENLENTLLKIKNYQNNIIYKLRKLGIEGEKVAILIDDATNKLLYKFKNI